MTLPTDLWVAEVSTSFPDATFRLLTGVPKGDRAIELGEVLDATGLQYELLTVVHTDDEESLLTERQRECLTVAQCRGYFDVPRECTLAELADALDVDKSTASETICRGTARVLEQFLVGHE